MCESDFQIGSFADVLVITNLASEDAIKFGNAFSIDFTPGDLLLDPSSVVNVVNDSSDATDVQDLTDFEANSSTNSKSLVAVDGLIEEI